MENWSVEKKLHVTECRFLFPIRLCHVIARRLKTDEAISFHLKKELATLPLVARNDR